MFQTSGQCVETDTRAAGGCVLHIQGRALNALYIEILLHAVVGFSGTITLVFNFFGIP